MRKIDFDIDHPLAIKRGYKSLYRFMPVVSDVTKDASYLECLLIDGLLFLSAPSMFNDPFECKPHFSMSQNSAPALRKHLLTQARKSARRNNIKFNSAAASKTATDLLGDHEVANNLINHAILKVFRDIRICCFSPNRENLLFWSHYAKSHQGVCIEFDCSYAPMNGARKVKYTETYPSVIYPFPSELDSVVPILTKSKEWSYEEEFRISLRENNPLFVSGTNYLNLDKGAIKSVTLGACISDEDKDTVMKIANESKFTPKVFQSKLSTSKFGLVFEEIK